MSEAAAVTKTTALPDRFNALPEFELSLTVRLSNIPELVYWPWPISQALPSSSIVYRTWSPSLTPAAAKVWYPSEAEPRVMGEEVPVLAVVIFALLTNFTISLPLLSDR
jgi:hypothetical protein